MSNFTNKKSRNYMRMSGLLTLFSFLLMNVLQAQVSRLSSHYHTPYQDSYQRIAAGYNHYLEIKNGKLYASGSNSNGQLGVETEGTSVNQPVLVGTDENWVTITAGDGFSLGIKADGTLWAWGKNDKGQLGIGSNVVTETPTQVGIDKWFSVSAGAGFVLGIKADGTLWAWGDNSMGQLGNGTNNYSANPDPIQVGAANNWWKVSAGYMHSLALKADGTLWAWGANALGQIGNGNTSFMGEHAPIQIGSDKWKEISAGGFFSTGIQSDGTLWGWGDNYYGQIANGNTDNQLTPAPIGTEQWKSVYAGRNHVAGLKSDGTLWVWADEMGTGTSQPGVITHKTELSGIVQVSAGDSFSFALKSNGELYSWGKNNVGQLGQGNTVDTTIPTFNNSISEEIITVASAHWFTTFTLYSNGTIKGWGSNSDFELGIDTNGVDQNTPIAIPTAQNDNIAVLPGIEHTLVLKDNGTLWGWGAADVVGSGGTSGTLETATQVGSNNDWLMVTAGSFSSAGIKTDGTLWTWGSNYDGELGTGDTAHKTAPVQVGTNNNWRNVAMGASHTIAIQSDGTLWGWGRNYAGEAVGGEDEDDVLSPQQIGTDNDWVYVSAGSMTSFAIKANGTLWGWGAAGMGQIGLDTPLPVKVTTPTKIGTDSFIQARVANWSGAGLKADGTVLAWGNLNSVFGELGMGDNTNYPIPTPVPNQSDVIHISGGQVHKSILKSSREDVCMVGRNFSGELGIGTDVMSINTYQCGIAPFEGQQIIVIESVIVTVENNADAEIIAENGTLQLVATVNPSDVNQEVVWSIQSGNEFASVDNNGLVTAVANGVVTVRATSVEDEAIYGEIEILIDYEVIIPVESIIVTVQGDAAPEITTENGTLQLIATVNPSDVNQEVTWSIVSGNDFASVDENGLVTAVANGTATVRATSVEDDTIYGEIEILIDYEIIIPVESVIVTVQGDAAPEITTENGTLQLLATVNPSDVNQEVTWSIVSGNDFASVDENGVVTAVANGTVTVRATSVEDDTIYGEIEILIDYEIIIPVESVIVTVQGDAAPEITTENGTLQLLATVNPSDVNQEVTWSIVSGNDFASVDENGVVTAVANGTATVRAMSVEDESIFGEIEVIINIDTVGTDSFNKSNIKIYPNPAADFIQIETIETIGEVIIINSLGQQVWKGNNNQIDVSGLNTGVYIIKVSLKNNITHTQKIIKK